jgi:uracil-DNA glycosylase family 4
VGFLASGKKQAANGGMPSLDMLHRLQCRVCPLDKIAGNRHPHMEPTGSDKPLIYVLGEAPGKTEDWQDEQFVGESGQILRARIPHEFRKLIRWNNTVRTRPYKNDTPQKIEIECCRPSVAGDIARTRPKAIFGFGNIPLAWSTGMSGIKQWRGRRTPVSINGHECWFYSFHHPAYLLRLRKHGRISETERAFQFDLDRAFDEIDDIEEAKVYSAADADAGLEIIECSASGLERLEQRIRWAMQEPSTGLDWETWPKRPYADGAIILSAGIGTDKASFTYALDHPQAKWTKAQRKRVQELTYEYLTSKTRKVSHFLNFEMEWAAMMFGAETLRDGYWDDTYNQAAILDERQGDSKPGCLSLEFLVQLYFGFNLKSLSPLNVKDLRKEPLKDVLHYNGMDARWHFMLERVQRKLLKDQGLLSNYKADLRKIPALVLTQMKSPEIYQPAVKSLVSKYEPRVEEAAAAIAKMPEVKRYKEKFGEEFNPASNPQMGRMLTKILKRRECIKKDEHGNETISVDEDVLAKIDHPLAEWELKRRKAAKRLSTYIKPYDADDKEGHIWPDGCVHPTYNQPGTISNRTSAEGPNTQNVEKRDPEGKEVRKVFRARKGHIKVSADYGQIQFRGIAMASKDKRLIEYLWQQHDVHTDWTNEIAYAYPRVVGGKDHLKEWGKGGAMERFRNDVKNQWTFPSVFGAHIESRAEYLGVPVEKLKPIDRKFWKEFSGIADWHERVQKEYETYGSVKHLDGRLSRAPLARNQYINLPIQGMEAHVVIGHALCTLSERALDEGDLYFQPELEIHDDLDFELPLEKIHGAPALDFYVEEIVTTMLACPYEYINVPLTVEVAVGNDLYDMDKVLVASSDSWRK